MDVIARLSLRSLPLVDIRPTLTGVDSVPRRLKLCVLCPIQLGNIGLAVAAVLVLTKAVKGTSLAPLRVYLWAAGSAFVTWRITSTTVRRLVRLTAHVCQRIGSVRSLLSSVLWSTMPPLVE